MTPMLAAIGAYLLLQFAIGIYVSRRIATEEDYLIAGRQLGPWLATASIFATWFGAETIVGASGVAYQEGISLASVEPFGYGICIILAGAIFAVPLWRRRLTTLADLYRQRYSPGVERVAALVLIPPSLLWAAAQLRAFGQVIVVSGVQVDLDVGIAVAAVVVIAYTVVGGMLADSITDLLQAAVLVTSLVVLAVLVVVDAGGVSVVQGALAETGRVQWTPTSQDPWWLLMEQWAIPIAGSVISTELVSRIISSRSAGVARGAAIGAGTMYLVIGTIPLVLGVVAVPLFGTSVVDPEQVIPFLAQHLFPGWMYVLFAGGLISAILSTVDSTLLVSGGIGAHNLVLPFWRSPSDRTRVRVTRALVAIGGIIAWLLARNAEGVFALVAMASSFGTAGVLVTVCFALFTRWGGPLAALATLIGGMLAYVAAMWAAIPTPFLASLVASVLLYVGVALVERPSPFTSST